MKLMLQSPSIAPRLSRLKNAFAGSADGAVWTFDGGDLRAHRGVGARDILLVPSEDVLTLAVPLPLPSPAKRFAALPFAIEDRIAGKVDTVHLALGGQLDGGSWLAAVVDPERMAAWAAAAEAAGLANIAIMPDALALPVPVPGRWNVRRDPRGRILVRTPEGTGFAAEQRLFLPLWTAAGKPECDEIGEDDGLLPIVIDLRQGLFARPRQGLTSTGRRVAMVAAAGLLAHGAIAAADTVALRSIAAKRGAELTVLLATAAPGRYTGEDPREAAMVAAELLPAGQAGPPGSLLPILTRTSSALAPFGATVTVRAIGFDEAGRTLRFELDLADPSARRGIVDALRSSGLSGRFDGASLIVGGTAA